MSDDPERRAAGVDIASGEETAYRAIKMLNVVEHQVHENADEASGDRDKADHPIYRIFHGDGGKTAGI